MVKKEKAHEEKKVLSYASLGASQSLSLPKRWTKKTVITTFDRHQADPLMPLVP